MTAETLKWAGTFAMTLAILSFAGAPLTAAGGERIDAAAIGFAGAVLLSTGLALERGGRRRGLCPRCGRRTPRGLGFCALHRAQVDHDLAMARRRARSSGPT